MKQYKLGVLLRIISKKNTFFNFFVAHSEKSRTFAVPFWAIEIWCNGSTTDSGSVSEGSNPSISTKSFDPMAG